MTRKLLEVNYNLHGIVTIHISTIYRNILDFYNLSFRHFKSEEKTSPQKYFIRDYACFQLPPCFFYMDKECIGFDTGFCLPHEHYAVEVNDEGITEYTDAEGKSPHLWVQYLLLRQNMCMIHGAALELNGRGIIFPSVSGGGKTTLVAHLRNLNGFRFFTDEFVIIDSDGTMFSYPTDFSIYEFHLKLFPELQKPGFLNFFEKRKRIIQIFEGIAKIPTPSFLQNIKKFGLFPLSRFIAGPAYLKIPVTDLIPAQNLGTHATVDVAILLTRYNGEKLKSISNNPTGSTLS